MGTRIHNQLAWRCILAACLPVLAGCSRSDGRQALEGTVTLDGVPLAEASIAFRPLPGTVSPAAGGSITAGKFSIAREQGPCAGMFRVEITAIRPTGEKRMDTLTHTMVDAYEESIPQQYNTQSTLTADVTAHGPNRFTFDLAPQ